MKKIGGIFYIFKPPEKTHFQVAADSNESGNASGNTSEFFNCRKDIRLFLRMVAVNGINSDFGVRLRASGWRIYGNCGGTRR